MTMVAGTCQRCRIVHVAVAWLIAKPQCCLHMRHAIHVDDTDAVRQMIDHPHFIVGGCCNRDGLKPYRNRRNRRQRVICRVNLERVVGRADDIESLAIG